MIVIVSLILSVCLVISGFFIGFAPHLHALLKSDIEHKAELQSVNKALQYGELCLRARTLRNPPTAAIPDKKEMVSEYIRTGNTAQRCLKSTVSLTPGSTLEASYEITLPDPATGKCE